MPSERHIRRQIEWSEKLRKYGCKVSLEESIRVEGARVVPDVLAKAEGKTFIIEIGDIEDERKNALLSLYAKQDPNVEYVHEPYGSDKELKRVEFIKELKYKKLQKNRAFLRAVSWISGITFLLCILFSPYIKSSETIAIILFTFFCLWLLFGFVHFVSSPNTIFGRRDIPVKYSEIELNHHCPQCGQPCTKEEYKSGYCFDCNQVRVLEQQAENLKRFGEKYWRKKLETEETSKETSKNEDDETREYDTVGQHEKGSWDDEDDSYLEESGDLIAEDEELEEW